VGYVADQLAAQAVGLLQAFNLFPDLVGHAAEGVAQLPDFVGRRRPFARVLRGRDRVGFEPGAGKALHVRRQPGQAASQQAEHQQAHAERHEHDGEQCAEAGLLHVAAAHALGQFVVFLAAQDGIQVALQNVAMHHRVRREDLLAVQVTRIGAAQRHRAVAGHQLAHRLQRNPLDLHRIGRQRVGQDAALGIQQVDLDGGVDDHCPLRQQGQGVFLDLAILDQLHLTGYVHGDRGIQPLRDFLVIQPRGELLQCKKAAADQRDDQQQGQPEAGEQGVPEAVGHGVYTARRCVLRSSL
jgi:hypothetical protein